ncbi:protein kinase [Myxococcus stipitatus]|uniref:serine/threonine-protein kinase n=1 Tax=Myxococcus stipitatus TaxID=83455 RepID=UPI001F32A45D|nr:serine/threonine-protein kinase [Myxococcus stipitatus]MCE9669095.1 protein kinase [Myxococcus stipitatus]
MMGEVLAGRYRLERELGRGGMATVFLATDLRLSRPVAVKQMHPGGGSGRAERFRREAELAASLRHPNVLEVHDFGEDGARGPFLVCEWIQGEDLRALAERLAPVPPEAAVVLAWELARALAAAHARGVVHRDVKPENVLVATGGPLKLADFGLAALEDQERLTSTGAVTGSLAYMAPERIDTGAFSPASDVYAVGVILFELCAGRAPHEGKGAAHLAASVMSKDAPPLSEFLPGAPEPLVSLVSRCLARDPRDRPESGAALDVALAEVLGRLVGPPAEVSRAFLADPVGMAARWRRARFEALLVEGRALLSRGEGARAARLLNAALVLEPGSAEVLALLRERPRRSRWRGVAVGAGLVACGAVAWGVWLTRSTSGAEDRVARGAGTEGSREVGTEGSQEVGTEGSREVGTEGSRGVGTEGARREGDGRVRSGAMGTDGRGALVPGTHGAAPGGAGGGVMPVPPHPDATRGATEVAGLERESPSVPRGAMAEAPTTDSSGTGSTLGQREGALGRSANSEGTGPALGSAALAPARVDSASREEGGATTRGAAGNGSLRESVASPPSGAGGSAPSRESGTATPAGVEVAVPSREPGASVPSGAGRSNPQRAPAAPTPESTAPATGVSVETATADSVRPAVVKVTARPWAEVFVDGESRGYTPRVRELTLSPGVHRLRFSNPLCDPVELDVTLASGEMVSRDVTLTPRKAELVLVAPAGARLFLDGREVGIAPLPGPVTVEHGRHTVTARAPGLPVLQREVDVVAGRRMDVSLEVTP